METLNWQTNLELMVLILKIAYTRISCADFSDHAVEFFK